MIEWMIRSALAGVVIALATWLGSLALGWWGRSRRWLWSTGLAAAAVLPFLGLLLPARPAPAPAGAISPAELATLLAANAGVAGGASPAALPSWLPGALWAAVSLFLLLEQVYASARLTRLRRGWPWARLDGTDVLIAQHVGPAVVGVLKPTVVVPPWLVAAPERQRAMALAHEREHVRAGDTRLLAAGSLVTALLPWSPALWWLQRRLRYALETDCDARVLAAGCDVVAYGRMLMEAAARPGRPLARVALAERRNVLERRIRAMKSQLPSRPLIRAAGMAVGIIALIAAACELSSPPPAPTEAQQGSVQAKQASAIDGQRAVATDTGEITREVAAGYAAGRLAAEQELKSQGAPAPGGATVQRERINGGVVAVGGGVKVREVGGSGRPRPVVVLDGRPSTMEAVQALDPQRIATVDVIGVRPARGAFVDVPDTIKVLSKTAGAPQGGHQPLKRAVTARAMTAGPPPVVIVDGGASSLEALKALAPERISSMNVIKVARDRVANAGVPDTIQVQTKR